jgi:2-polyprenyl-6-methoxyphenol hydroxylase-like FAD-dependent oxidoreductase
MTPGTTTTRVRTDVLVVGSGPGGALIACLLARAGVDVLLVEKQASLERTFRGETIAARSVLTLRELGFEQALRNHGFVEMTGIGQWEGGRRVVHFDYRRFPIDALPIDIPQPALVNAILEQALDHPNFSFRPSTILIGLIEEKGTVHGAVLRADGERIEVNARLVVGADGRFSKVRKLSRLPVDIRPLDRDFLWFKLPRPDAWGHDGAVIVQRNKHLVVLPAFPDLLRVGYNLPKRGLADIRSQGLEEFKNGICSIAPQLAPLVDEHISAWEDTSFLEIFTAEMPLWARDGLLLIGDAAHTCTPILGQGVNLAIQDAVFFAPVIGRAMAQGRGTTSAEVFDEVLAVRRAHKAMVTRFQRIQESALAQSSAVAGMLRRIRLRALDLVPFKYHLLDHIMNSPREMPAEASRVDA